MDQLVTLNRAEVRHGNPQPLMTTCCDNEELSSVRNFFVNEGKRIVGKLIVYSRISLFGDVAGG